MLRGRPLATWSAGILACLVIHDTRVQAQCLRSILKRGRRRSDAPSYFNKLLQNEGEEIMTSYRRTIVTVVCAIAILSSVAVVGAQDTSKKFNREVVTMQNGVVTGEPMTFAYGGQGDNTFVFVSSEMSIDGKVVKGAPYSAQATTEMVQTLADGNRIVRRTNASVYRDGEGRTRREQTLNAVGAYSSSGDAQQTIFINDPVGQVNYILDAKNHTARKVDLSGMTMVRKKLPEGAAANSEQHQKEMAELKAHMAQSDAARSQEGANSQQHQEAMAELKAHMAQANATVVTGSPGAVNFERTFTTRLDAKDSKKESLGKQTIEGVEAEGTRFTTTIAAGEVGNEQPISIVSESWYSPELQTVVMSKHSDPRVGENTYRLTNINRAEPAHSLFELPADYTVKETERSNMRYKLETEVRKPGVQN